MADDVDIANDRAEQELEAAIRRTAKPIAPGVPGDCDYCGEWSGRLIGGACAPCRDKRGLA